jgi:hypothetical protein
MFCSDPTVFGNSLQTVTIAASIYTAVEYQMTSVVAFVPSQYSLFLIVVARPTVLLIRLND